MTDEENSRWLVTRPSGELCVLPATTNRLVSEMVEVSLAITRQAALFKIGEYEWREPDFRQLLMWAEALKMEPATVINKLVARNDARQAPSRFHDGRMLSLTWNLAELPLTNFKCVEGLTIEELRLYEPLAVRIKSAEIPDVSVSLRSLRLLNCRCRIGVLTLSDMPSLTVLDCDGSGLKKLNLSGVPNLNRLRCSSNQLRDLDLAQVPNLSELACYQNPLSELDLSNVPNLSELWWGDNQFTKLDLSHVPNLTKLWCARSQLTELDLSHVPNLTELCCHKNQLPKLDLSHVPNLSKLWCFGNQLTELDLTHVPNLTNLWCHGDQLTQLDIRPCQKLSWLSYGEEQTRLIHCPNQQFDDAGNLLDTSRH
jgi:Leucine-rich repeat (LRR) protein